jgi:hypothetical protein
MIKMIRVSVRPTPEMILYSNSVVSIKDFVNQTYAKKFQCLVNEHQTSCLARNLDPSIDSQTFSSFQQQSLKATKDAIEEQGVDYVELVETLSETEDDSLQIIEIVMALRYPGSVLSTKVH